MVSKPRWTGSGNILNLFLALVPTVPLAGVAIKKTQNANQFHSTVALCIYFFCMYCTYPLMFVF